MALLEVNEIHAHYGAIEALKGVSLTVEEGEVVTLIGSNGAGKSTTLRAITGLTPASSGSVVIDGEDITRVPAHEIVDRGIALSPEGRHCFPRMTVRENLDLGAHRRRGDASVARGPRARVRAVPAPAGAREAEGRHDVRRRAADARDRPRADGHARGCCCSTSRRWASRRSSCSASTRRSPRSTAAGMTILLVEQNANYALDVSSAATCSRPAASCSRANPTSCATDPEVQRAYLGA